MANGGPTIDEYNAALRELEGQAYTPIDASEFVSQDPYTELMSQQPEVYGAPEPYGPPAVTAEDAALAALFQQVAAREQEIEAQQADQQATAPDELAQFGQALAGERAPAQYQAVNPYAQQAAARPPAFRPRRAGGGVAGLVGRMGREAEVAGQAAQQKAIEAQAEADKALAARRAAIETRGAALELGAARQAELQRNMAAEVEQELQGRAERQEAAQARRETFFQEYEQARSEANAMQPPHDRRTRGNVIMGAIAVALSGIGDAIAASGGVRQSSMQATLGIIDKAVERDLQEQREARAAARGKVGDVLHRLDVFDKMASSEEQASLMREAALRKEYADQMQAVAIEQQGTEAGQVAAESSAALQQQASQMEAAAADAEAMRSLEKSEKLRLTRAQMQRQAAAGPSPERALKLEKQRLEVEKMRRELTGKAPGKLGDAERKLQRQVRSVEGDAALLREVAAAGEVPTVGVRGVGALFPDRLTPAGNIRYRNAVNRLAEVGLRDVSGAAIGAEERQQRLDNMGVFSSDDEVAQQGLRALLREYEVQRQASGLSPDDGGARGKFRPRK